MALSCPLSLCKTPTSLIPSSFLGSSPSNQHAHTISLTRSRQFKSNRETKVARKRTGIVCGLPLPVDPWAPTINSESIASQLFAFSLFPYIGFLYFITKSKSAPKLTLFGFYFLLAFVGATSEFFQFSLLPYSSSNAIALLEIVYCLNQE